MAVDTLRLDEVLKQAERVHQPLALLGRTSSNTARELKETVDQLKKLQQQQTQLGDYRALRSGLADTTARLRGARQQMAQLRLESGAGEQPSRAMLRALRSAQVEEERLALLRATQRSRLMDMREGLRGAGVDTGNLSAHERKLHNDIRATTAQMEKQRKVVAPAAQRLERIDALREQSKNLADRGQALRETGGKMLAPVRAVSQAFMTDDQAAAQLRATMAGSNGKPGADYQQVLDMAKSLGTDMPGSTADYIAMMNQLQRQGVSSQDVLGGVARQAANLGAVLNMPAKEAGEFAAQLQQATRASAGDMAALADTVQRTSHLGLDPTGMVKGLDAIGKALPQLGQQGARSGQMFAPLLLMLNDASISGEAAGKAVGNLVKNSMDPAKLGQVNKMLASQGVSLDFKDASGKFGGTEQMMAQLQKLQSLGSDKLRAAALDKLAGGDAQTRKALEALLQQGPGGYQQIASQLKSQADLDGRVAILKDSVSAQYESVKDSYNGLLSDMGSTIESDLKAVLGTLREMTEGMRAWVKEHPQIVQWTLRIVAVLGLLIAGVGVVSSVLFGLLAPLLLTRTVFGLLGAAMGAGSGALGVLRRGLAAVVLSLGMMGGGGSAMGLLAGGMRMASNAVGVLRRGVGAVVLSLSMMSGGGGAMGLLSGGLRMASNAAGVLRRGLGAVVLSLAMMGRGAAMGSIGTALAGAGRAAGRIFGGGAGKGRAGAVMGLLGAGLGAAGAVGSGLGGSLGGAAASLMGLVRMTPMGRLAGGLMGAGGSIMQNWDGLSTAFKAGDWKGVGGTLLEAGKAGLDGATGGLFGVVSDLAGKGISGLASSVGSWFKSGDASAPDQGRAGALRQGVAAAATAATLATGAMPAMADTGAVRIDSRPPLASAAAPAPAPAPVAGATIHITVNAAPGQDAQAIARAVAAELDRRDMAKRSSVLSQLSDID
ncbi:phage tail tape measure protein, TP901 family, core region [Delftia acidovorans CCUG 274B]|uniref:phage tail tape measure protein n=1 Tax=Delftia acidovorans TaxID=80866 RepID=UPI000353E3B4|nr:phage tail tape measure protein [Delftia acidovorans]EPD34098.1 phage tail tape measure protein, TP901 family, core region [Delftia acidovorans CCUG 274B]PZP76437.1 MAG: phage tail tape measure protein [Delftia acidovorans]